MRMLLKGSNLTFNSKFYNACRLIDNIPTELFTDNSKYTSCTYTTCISETDPQAIEVKYILRNEYECDTLLLIVKFNTNKFIIQGDPEMRDRLTTFLDMIGLGRKKKK